MLRRKIILLENLMTENIDEQFVIYQSKNKAISLPVKLEKDTVWLTQAQMTELFGRDRTIITKHINKIFQEGELVEKSNVQNLHIAFSDKPVKLYNLDIVISVGYRVKSLEGTRFRQWATKTLRDCSIYSDYSEFYKDCIHYESQECVMFWINVDFLVIEFNRFLKILEEDIHPR